MSIEEREDELFERWRIENNITGSFDTDGVINPEVWKGTKPKILFVLKETNALNGDLRTFLKEGGSPTYYRTWNNIARWTNVILNKENLDYVSNEERQDLLQNICAINLKKESGGSASNENEIREAAKRDKVFIRKQIDLYEPDVVVACGFELVAIALRDIVYEEKAAVWQKHKNGLEYYSSDLINKNKPVYVISMPHPNRSNKTKWSESLAELQSELNPI